MKSTALLEGGGCKVVTRQAVSDDQKTEKNTSIIYLSPPPRKNAKKSKIICLNHCFVVHLQVYCMLGGVCDVVGDNIFSKEFYL